MAESPKPPSPPTQAPDGAAPDVDLSPLAGVTNPPPPGGMEARTYGERKFDRLAYFGLGGVVVFALSVVAMFTTKYGTSKSWFSDRTWAEGWQHSIQKISDWKIWQSLSETKLGQMKAFDFLRDRKSLENMSETVLTSSSLFTGGTMMAAPIWVAEQHKHDFIHRQNLKHGGAEEAARGDENLRQEAKQTGGSLVKGRVAAWITVFTSLTLGNWLLKKIASALAPQSQAAEKGLGAFEAWVGKHFRQAHEALAPQASEAAHQDWQHIGEITAIDAFATTAAANILKDRSKYYSQKAADAKKDKYGYRDALGDRPKSFTERAETAVEPELGR